MKFNYFLTALLFLSLFAISCNKETKNEEFDSTLPLLLINNQFVHLDDKATINKVMHERLDALIDTEFEINETELLYSKEAKSFYVKTIAFKTDGYALTVGIPVGDKKIKDDKTYYLVEDAGCSHTCESSVQNVCRTCSLTILENCKRQSCSCTSNDGGCSGSITLN